MEIAMNMEALAKSNCAALLFFPSHLLSHILTPHFFLYILEFPSKIQHFTAKLTGSGKTFPLQNRIISGLFCKSLPLLTFAETLCFKAKYMITGNYNNSENLAFKMRLFKRIQ
jgi:hypothetical protein